MAEPLILKFLFEGTGALRGLDNVGKATKNLGESLNRAKEGASKFGGVIQVLGNTSSTTGKMLGTMLGGLAAGGPMGIALAGVQLLVNHFQEAGAAAKRAAEETKKWQADLGKQIEDNRTAIRLLMAEMSGGDYGVAREKAAVAQEKAAAEVAKASAARQAMEDQRKVVFGVKGQVFGSDDDVEQYKRLKDAEAKAIEDLGLVTKRTEIDVGKAREAAGKAATKAAEDALKKAQEAAKVAAEAKVKADAIALGQAPEGGDAGMRRDITGELQLEGAITAKQIGDDYRKEAEKGNESLYGKSPIFAGGDNEGSVLAQSNKKFNEGKAKDASKEMDAFNKQLETTQMVGATIADTLGSFGDAIGGSTGKMTATLGKLIQQAMQLAIAMSATAGPFAWLNIAASAAAIISTIASVPQMRAAGGPVMAGQPYIVGEIGPELFVPSMSGKIVPNNQLGGRTTQNTYVINAIDTKSFYSALKSNDGQLIRVLNEASKDGRF
ncbi:hypothetical protein [Anaeromyxobacter sp. PSR-1]|uniref:hypothetical protein n=1 Tax=Anaeromyxobacter sp. PSR-1 TaxID=1300915 RepID=UPI0005DAD4DC|nr:hypothetical protein [Anaeromyxobacter sp. PSR-1]GAO01923.1 hypothetical protein PSR1_00786 [Anaeromyxobacter sp. PSR-1]